MGLAKAGDIHEFCRPNSVLTLVEYLEDYASPESSALGTEIIRKSLETMENDSIRRQTEERLERIKHGERYLYF